MAREGGLGKGLSSLIPQKKPTVNSSHSTPGKDQDLLSKNFGSEASIQDFKKNQPNKSGDKAVLEVPLNQINANPFQPRKHFNEEKLNELAASIKKHGVIQPLLVTKRPEGGYELVAGERRFKASQKSGLSEVPVIIKKISDKEKMEWALIENVQRDDLNAIEEAEAYESLAQKFDYTQKEIANQVGKSRSSIANTLRLLELSNRLKSLIKNEEITEGHARALLGIEDENKRELLANEIIKLNLSVRETENKIRKINNPANSATSSASKDPNLMEIETKISEVLGTKVDIKKGKRGGRFVLNFYSEEEFKNLFNKLIS